MSRVIQQIRAVYETRCPVCEKRIEVDDQIALVDDTGWVHEGCVDAPSRSHPANPLCPECFIHHAGECA